MSQRRQRGIGMLRISLFVGALAALALAAGSASAQSSEVDVSVAGLTSDDWPEAQAVVTVLDDDGRPVGGLTEADFAAQLNDQSLPIRAVSRAVDSSLAIDVVLALDVSGSMGDGALAQAKDAAHDFLAGLAADDSVAVVAFSDAVTVVQPFTQDRDMAAEAIDGLVAEGETALYQATSESIQLAAETGNGRQAVVILSDGVDNGSAVSRGDALGVAETVGVPVIAIGLGADIDRAYLEALAEASGGRFAATPSAAGLAQLYQDAAELLRGQYVLTVDGSELELDRSEVATLRVDISAESATGGGERLVCTQALCITLLGLEAGERLDAERTVIAQVVAADPVTEVAFSVDGEVAARTTEPPYEFTFVPDSYSDGEHSLAVEVTTAGSESALREIGVRTGAAGGGGLSMIMVGAAIVAVLAVAILAYAYFRYRRGRGGGGLPDLRPEPRSPEPDRPPAGVAPPPEEQPEPAPVPAAPAREEALGRLVVTSGPLAGETFDVSRSPLSIGSGTRCRIRLPEDEGPVATEHTRVWVRDGRLMVHELRRLTSYGATGGNWQILATGDTFSIGPTTIQFELIDPAADDVPEQPVADDVPNILRDRDDGPPQVPVTRSGGDGPPLFGEPHEARSGGQPSAGGEPNIDRAEGAFGRFGRGPLDDGATAPDASPPRSFAGEE